MASEQATLGCSVQMIERRVPHPTQSVGWASYAAAKLPQTLVIPTGAVTRSVTAKRRDLLFKFEPTTPCVSKRTRAKRAEGATARAASPA
jgi:hypothetical protein